MLNRAFFTDSIKRGKCRSLVDLRSKEPVRDPGQVVKIERREEKEGGGGVEAHRSFNIYKNMIIY